MWRMERWYSQKSTTLKGDTVVSPVVGIAHIKRKTKL
tara:strand:+ start:148 stop:258 length:111 start_codon:yes stop_codon:yes gene_type:complete